MAIRLTAWLLAGTLGAKAGKRATKDTGVPVLTTAASEGAIVSTR